MPVWKITFPVKDLSKKKQKHMGNLGFGGHKVTSKADLDYYKEHFKNQGFYPKGSKLHIEKYKNDLRGNPIMTTHVTSQGGKPHRMKGRKRNLPRRY
jgi:hypothetical protein